MDRGFFSQSTLQRDLDWPPNNGNKGMVARQKIVLYENSTLRECKKSLPIGIDFMCTTGKQKHAVSCLVQSFVKTKRLGD